MARRRRRLKGTLTDQIRREILESDMTEYRIAKELGVTQSTITRFMAGGGMSCPNLDTLAKLLNLRVIQVELFDALAERNTETTK